MRTIKCEFCGQEYKINDDAWDPRKCPICHTDYLTGLPPEVDVSFIDILMLLCSIALIFLPILTAIIYGFDKRFLECITGIAIGIGWLVYFYRKYSEAFSMRHIAKTDREKYKSILKSNIKQKIDTKKSDAIRIEEETNVRLAHTPACPICGSKHNVVRVSAIDRSVSTAVWGVASDAIGKQWECTACHHKFNADTVVQQLATPTQQPQATTTDPTEELRKYKKLLDDGIITKEDFEKKKNQLLGL